MLLWNALEPEETIVPPEKINMLKLRADLFNGVEKIPTLNFIKDISSGKFDHLLLSAEVGNTVELSADAQTALMLYHTMTPEAWALMRDHTDKFIAIARRVFNIGETKPLIDISRFGVSCIAIPKSLGKIPEYLLPFIDYSTMVNNNMTNGYIILESLGICCEEVQTTKYKSNIISI